MMENYKVSNWKEVFSFTFMQQIKSKSFKITTGIIGIIIFLAVFLALTISDKKTEEERDILGIENINQVYILDETERFEDFNSYIELFVQSYEINPELGGVSLEGISFVQVSKDTEISQVMSDLENVNDGLLVNIKRDYSIEVEEEAINVKALLPQQTEITNREAEMLLESMLPIFEMYRMGISGISQEQLAIILKPTVTSVVDVGEEEDSFGEEVIKLMVPMFYSLILYMFLIVYASQIMNTMLIEKTSKLTEMLLTSVNPKSVITGKTLALSLAAILQFLAWIICGFLGFVVGDIFLNSQYPDYSNPVLEVIELVRDNSGGFAFSPIAIILSILALCLGILFYFSFAGVAGATLGKAEDISAGTGLYYLPVVIFGLAAAMIPMLDDSLIVKMMDFFPFTSPFILPTGIINGDINTLSGIISIAILILSTIICFILAGKLYKGLIFFKGEKLTFANVIHAIKGID